MNGLRRRVRDEIIREYHRLGCRTTELVHLLGQPRANVQRALHAVQAPCTLRTQRKLTGLDQRLLAAFWYELAGRYGLDPPPLGPAFLQSFCDLCREPVAPSHRCGRHPPELVLGGVDEVFAAAVLLCTENPDPQDCLAGPARFALFCAGLHRDPWTAAVFVTQHVSSRRIWVRPCLRCDQNFLSPSNEHQHCGCSPQKPGSPPFRPTRLARVGLALLR